MQIYSWEKILDKLNKAGVQSFEIDIRYLTRWIRLYPSCFPKCMINKNYTPIFNSKEYKWEIWSGKHEIKFNPKNYL